MTFTPWGYSCEFFTLVAKRDIEEAIKAPNQLIFKVGSLFRYPVGPNLAIWALETGHSLPGNRREVRYFPSKED